MNRDMVTHLYLGPSFFASVFCCDLLAITFPELPIWEAILSIIAYIPGLILPYQPFP